MRLSTAPSNEWYLNQRGLQQSHICTLSWSCELNTCMVKFLSDGARNSFVMRAGVNKNCNASVQTY